jgi:hypothetical protein
VTSQSFLFRGTSPSSVTLGDGTELRFHPGEPTPVPESAIRNEYIAGLIAARLLVASAHTSFPIAPAAAVSPRRRRNAGGSR